jgi:hypothetical protein
VAVDPARPFNYLGEFSPDEFRGVNDPEEFLLHIIQL